MGGVLLVASQTSYSIILFVCHFGGCGASRRTFIGACRVVFLEAVHTADATQDWEALQQAIEGWTEAASSFSCTLLLLAPLPHLLFFFFSTLSLSLSRLFLASPSYSIASLCLSAAVRYKESGRLRTSSAFIRVFLFCLHAGGRIH